jgi:hypothetical protein
MDILYQDAGLHDSFTEKPGFFLAQVVGESINRLISSNPILYFEEFQSLN